MLYAHNPPTNQHVAQLTSSDCHKRANTARKVVNHYIFSQTFQSKLHLSLAELPKHSTSHTAAMKLRHSSAVLLMALLGCAVSVSARKTQQRPAQGATGQPVEMSSMAITFYNSGKSPWASPYCVQHIRAPRAEPAKSRSHGAGCA